MKLTRSILAAAATSAIATASAAPPVTLPFDFSQQAIGLQVALNHTPLFALLDTGVDPSTIDLSRAKTLGLKIDTTTAGQGAGFGDGAAPTVFPTTITGLTVAGLPTRPFSALAIDLSPIAKSFGRPIDAVLGASFLADKTVLINYPAHTLTILQSAADARPLTQTCRQHWSAPLRTVDDFPQIPAFRLGTATAPVTLDTGSTGGISLFQSALALPGVKSHLLPTGETTRRGFRGISHVKLYNFTAPIALGPFTLPPGQPVVLRPESGSPNRVANLGNTVFAAMGLRLMMDYPSKRIVVFGACAPN